MERLDMYDEDVASDYANKYWDEPVHWKKMAIVSAFASDCGGVVILM